MGILATIGLLVVLIIVHEFGHWIAARAFGFKTPVFSIGFGKREHSLILGKFWDTEFRLSPILLGGYVSIPELGDETSDGKEPHRFFPIWKRFIVASAGVVMNVLVAALLIYGLFATVGKPHYEVQGLYINQVVAAGPAQDAGLQAQDRIVSVDGKTIVTLPDLQSALAEQRNEPTAFVVEREGVRQTITVTPDGDGKIGVALGATQQLVYEQLGPVEAAGEAVSATGSSIKAMYVGLGQMVGLVPAPEGTDTSVHGIIAIVSIGSQAFSDSLFSFIWLMAMISLNLAVINYLPVPLLDGGHVLFMAVEKVRGKAVSMATRSKISMIFLVLLLMLMFTGVFNDIRMLLK